MFSGAVQAETEGSVVLHEAAILPSWHCILVPSRKWSRSSRYNRRVAPISISSMLDSVLTALLSAVGARELLLLLPSCFNGDSQFIFPGHPRSKLWTRWWWLLHEGWSLRATVDRHFSIDLLYHEDESYWVKIITFGHPPHGQRNPGYHPLWVFLPNCLVNAYSSFLWVGSEKKSSSNIAISLNIKCGHLFYSIYSLSIQLLL